MILYWFLFLKYFIQNISLSSNLLARAMWGYLKLFFDKKVITKAMTNRMKAIMSSMVVSNQSIFVPLRQIADNVVIYKEVLHSMRTKKSCVGFMIIKIDLEKAYNRLSWRFICDTLKKSGIPS